MFEMDTEHEPLLTNLQRHILVKGCGKAAANSDDTKRESHSPKSEAVESKAMH